MRIISDFKDYYDFLSDPSDTYHIWNRKTEIITIHKNDPDFKNFNNYYSNISPYTHSIIGSRTWFKSIKEFNRDTIEFRTSLLMFCGNPYIIMTTSEQPDRYFYFGKDGVFINAGEMDILFTINKDGYVESLTCYPGI